MKRNLRTLLLAVTLGLTGTLLSTPSYAVTKRAANVNVFNYTPKVIEWVSVAHKYSNNYKDHGAWGQLMPNTGTINPMRAYFNTGFGTTGQDWWVVSWKYAGDSRTCFTNPNNFRIVIEELERGALKQVRPLGEKAGAYLVSLIHAGLAKPGALIGGEAAQALGNALLNTESTVGFKKHVLRESDTRSFGVYMDIYDNGKLRINSPSGASWTVYDCR